MTLSQAAGLIGTSPDNLRGAIHRGTLTASPDSPRDLNGRILVHLIEPEEVERYRNEVAGKFGRKPNTKPDGSSNPSQDPNSKSKPTKSSG